MGLSTDKNGCGAKVRTLTIKKQGADDEKSAQWRANGQNCRPSWPRVRGALDYGRETSFFRSKKRLAACTEKHPRRLRPAWLSVQQNSATASAIAQIAWQTANSQAHLGRQARRENAANCGLIFSATAKHYGVTDAAKAPNFAAQEVLQRLLCSHQQRLHTPIPPLNRPPNASKTSATLPRQRAGPEYESLGTGAMWRHSHHGQNDPHKTSVFRPSPAVLRALWRRKNRAKRSAHCAGSYGTRNDLDALEDSV